MLRKTGLPFKVSSEFRHVQLFRLLIVRHTARSIRFVGGFAQAKTIRLKYLRDFEQGLGTLSGR